MKKKKRNTKKNKESRKKDKTLAEKIIEAEEQSLGGVINQQAEIWKEKP